MPKISKRELLLVTASVAGMSTLGIGCADADNLHQSLVSAGPADDLWVWMTGGMVSSPGNSFEVMCPPAARTATSIAVVWNKPSGARVHQYDIYMGDRLVGSSTHTDYTFEGLKPNKAYEFSVHARYQNGTAIESNRLVANTKPNPKVVDILSHGAIADGQTINTRAIQNAIDKCPVGGVVRVPAGAFVSGALFLKSDMTLHLEKGALLVGSADPADYPLIMYREEGREKLCYASLVGTPEARGSRWRNISITGDGTIDGNGSILRKRQVQAKAGERGRLVSIRDTDGVYIKGVTLRQSPMWCLHPVYCDGMTINGVSIHTKYDQHGELYKDIVNGDGLDPDSCRNVFIFNCFIASQDDCIAIKSGRDADGRAKGIPSENIRVSNCRFESGFGVAIGSEMSGGIRKVLVEDCVFKNTFSIASVKAPRPRGGVIEDIIYRDCQHTNAGTEHHDGRWFRGALYIDQYYGVAEPDLTTIVPQDVTTPTIQRILFQNLSVDTVGGNAVWFAGLPENPLVSIRLENVSAVGEKGFIAYNIRGLAMDNVNVTARTGEAMKFFNVVS